MNKIWGIIVISFGMNGVMRAAELVQTMQAVPNPTEEWRHIIEATKNLSGDKKMQKAMQELIAALQKVLSLGVKRIAHQVSPAEKEKIIVIIELLNGMVDVYGDDSARTGIIDNETADELRQLGQALTVLVMPLLFLAQDPVFANEQVQLLQDLRISTYNSVKRTLNQLNNELNK